MLSAAVVAAAVDRRRWPLPWLRRTAFLLCFALSALRWLPVTTESPNAYAMWKELCFKAKCEVVFQPKCPDDSVLVPAPPPELPECCPKPGSCQCVPELCLRKMKACPPGFQTVRVAKAKNKPGSCCDKFECVPLKYDCSHVKCPKAPVEDCPSDSYRPPEVLPENGCCPIIEPCRCAAGKCPPVSCLPNHRLNITRKGNGTPGSCCDVFHCIPIVPAVNESAVTCKTEDMLHNNGDTWHPEPCTKCECRDGIVFCSSLTCKSPPSGCSRIEIPEGECCPVCTGCATKTTPGGDLKLYKVNETWRKDECTTCSCVDDGTVVCHVQVCNDDCEKPQHVEGQCCPTCANAGISVFLPTHCPSIAQCSLLCEHGLRSDSKGCLICECENYYAEEPVTTDSEADQNGPVTGSSNCTVFDPTTCTKKCAHGFEHDSNNCPMCKCKGCPQIQSCHKTCLYGFQTNINGCRICKCRTSPSDLPNEEDAGNSSSVDLAVCYSESGFHDHGEWWFDNCRHCYCDRGREFCSLLACPKPNCTHPVFNDGECCPQCPGSKQDINAIRLACHAPSDTHHYVEGEYWNLDSCVTCTCHVGYVLCYRKECPPVPCSKPKIMDDQCCPVCNDKDLHVYTPPQNLTFCTTENGISHMEGSVWKETQCMSCACENGKINCYEEECFDVPCYTHVLHLKDSCCPVCTDNMRKSVCRINDLTYNVGETWRDGPCRNCTCMNNGEILCSQLECRKCSKPVYAAGQCCPICEEYPVTWHWQPTPSYPEITGRYDDAQQVSLILALSVIGILGLLLLLVLLTFWFLKKFRAPPVSKTAEARLTGFKLEEKGKALLHQMKTSSNGVCNGLASHKTIDATGGLLNDVDGSVNDWANDDV